ncbi:hypothetical protein QQF64_004545, partial [Cirrhinus molitorella]
MMMFSVKRHTSRVPAPVGKEWCFQFSVGVDCIDPEPRCIWLVILRNAGARPCSTPKVPGTGTIHWDLKMAKRHKDGGLSSNQNTQRVSGKGMDWKGPRTVVLEKNSQSFGFTLRHFIVYPPESALHTNLKVEENGNCKGGQRSCLEPVDTIFVKNVKEKGPAHQAGLCTGDRLVKVNGESVLGKTYSQVIALIQNSDNVLELSIMPKDEDVLQLAYSQDAYLRGNEPYTGEAQNLPEPPPVCYPSSKPTSTTQNHSLPDSLKCKPNLTLDSSGIIVGSQHAHHHLTHHCAHSSSSAGIINMLDFHFANHNAAIASASLHYPRKGSLPQACGELCHQALSNWYYSQAERPGLGMSHQHRTISHDQLCELGLALGGSCSGWPNSPSQDTLLHHYSATIGANHSLRKLCRWGQTSSHSCSKNLLTTYASYEQGYSCSLDTIEKASVLILPHYKRPAWPHQRNQPSRVEEHSSLAHHEAISTTVPPSNCGLSQARQLDVQNKCLPAQVTDDQKLGYCSYTPSFCQKPSQLMQQPHSFSDPSNPKPHLSWTLTSKTDPLQSMCSTTTPESVLQDSATAGSVVSGFSKETVQAKSQEVVLRQKHPPGKIPQGVLHANYALPEDTPEPLSATAVPSMSEETLHQTNGGIPTSLVEQDFLATIPFIGNLKNSRRSSYLLAITTERSKSCDEGLNTFRDEGSVFLRLPKRVKSFFTDASLENLRTTEETRFKRHSTSELGNITPPDIRKEGWLHYKQILTKKGKKVGGGMRPWKRVFSVLRTYSLFLYKDKREAVLHAGGAIVHSNRQGEDEQPISIRGCLIDIAYSETKRKHTLRLTTQDFCEYLLQAEDRDDMLSWIRVIRENSKTDNEELGFSRQALINKKLNDYRKQSPTGNKPTENISGVNRAQGKDESTKASWGINITRKGKKMGPKAFGVRLEDCPPAANNKFVPQIVETCCRLVEEVGLEYTGIYRVPGNNAVVSSLQDQLIKGMYIDTTEEKWQDLNVISSLLKSFFRTLPEPLFTDEKYNDFIDANRLEDAGDRLKTIKKLIHDLPDHYYYTLKFLIGHLKTVADHSVKNKMEPRNLALVFGPTLVRTSEDNIINMVTHMPDRYKITETLILHYTWFFCDELGKDEKTPEDQKDIEPVPNIDHLLSNIGRT